MKRFILAIAIIFALLIPSMAFADRGGNDMKLFCTETCCKSEEVDSLLIYAGPGKSFRVQSNGGDVWMSSSNNYIEFIDDMAFIKQAEDATPHVIIRKDYIRKIEIF
jgi:hypothetical protein